MFTMQEARVGPYAEQDAEAEAKAERRRKRKEKKRGIEILKAPKPHMPAEIGPLPPTTDPGSYPPSEYSQS